MRRRTLGWIDFHHTDREHLTGREIEVRAAAAVHFFKSSEKTRVAIDDAPLTLGRLRCRPEIAALASGALG